MSALESKLVTLREEEQKLRAEQRMAGPAKKRLRQSLSEKERALLDFGMELAETEFKRRKVDANSEADGSETEG